MDKCLLLVACSGRGDRIFSHSLLDCRICSSGLVKNSPSALP